VKHSGIVVGASATDMAGCTAPIEHHESTRRSRGIEGSGRRTRSGDTVLIGAKRRQLGSDQVRGLTNVDSEARVRKVSLPVHLRHGHVGVPIGDRSLRRVRLVSDGRETVGGWQYEWCTLSIEVIARVVLARAPRAIDCFLRWSDRRGQGYDRADVEVAVGPAVHSVADSRRE
jgi:hypothetical protein